MYRLRSRFKGNFLNIEKKSYNNEKTNETIENWNKKIIPMKEMILKMAENKEIVKLIEDIDDIRNNLAHANSSKRLNDVDTEIKKILKKYKELIVS